MPVYDIKLKYKLDTYAGFVNSAQAQYFEQVMSQKFYDLTNDNLEKFYLSSVSTNRHIDEAVENLKKVNKKAIGISILISNAFNKLPWYLTAPIKLPMFMAWAGYKAAAFSIHAASKSWNWFLGLGQSAFSTLRGASGTGSLFGGYNAFNISAKYASVNPEAIINNVAKGRYDVTSEQAQGMRALKIKPSDDTSEMSIAVILGAARWAKKQEIANLDIMAKATNISSLFSGAEEIRSLRNMTEDDLSEIESNYKKNKAKMSLNEKEATQWSMFTQKMNVLNKIVFTRLTSKLTPVAQSAIALSDALVTRFQELMNSKMADDFFAKFNEYFRKFFLDSGEDFNKNMETYLHWLHEMASWVEKLSKHNLLRDAIRMAINGPTYGESENITNPIERWKKSRGVYARSPKERARILRGAGRDAKDWGAPEADISGIPTTDYKELRLKSGEAIRGGAADEGLVAMAQWTQKEYPGGIFSALDDAYHHNKAKIPYHSKHEEGLAFDFVVPGGNYAAARSKIRNYLTGLGFDESKDYWLEGDTYPAHLHFNWRTHSAAERYYKKVGRPISPASPDVKTPEKDKTRNDGTLPGKQKSEFDNFPAIRNFTGNSVTCYSVPMGQLPE